MEKICQKVISWNNKFICIGDKSVYFRNLAEIGISNKNELIIKSELRVLHLSLLDAFRLVSLIDALPTQWRESLKTCISTGDTPFNLCYSLSCAYVVKLFYLKKRIRKLFLKRTSKQNRHSTNC